MKTIYIIDVLNMLTPYQFIRCFEKNNKTYLVYTKGDRTIEKGMSYVKNYVVIKTKDDIWIKPTENEWTEFQQLIKSVASESSLGTVTSVKDIQMEDRSSVRVVNNRLFKVIPFYHHLLASNYNDRLLSLSSGNITNKRRMMEFPDLIHQFEISNIDQPKIDYTDEYLQLKEENEILRKKIQEIRNIINDDFDS